MSSALKCGARCSVFSELLSPEVPYNAGPDFVAKEGNRGNSRGTPERRPRWTQKQSLNVLVSFPGSRLQTRLAKNCFLFRGFPGICILYRDRMLIALGRSFRPFPARLRERANLVSL